MRLLSSPVQVKMWKLDGYTFLGVWLFLLAHQIILKDVKLITVELDIKHIVCHGNQKMCL